MKGQPKTRSQNLMGNEPSDMKYVRYGHSYFVCNNWFDLTMLWFKNGVKHQCTFLPILVINLNHFSVIFCSF